MKNSKDLVFETLTKNYSDWKIGEHTAYHKPSKVNWWIANGVLFCKPYDSNKVRIGLINRIKLYYYIRKAERQQIINCNHD